MILHTPQFSEISYSKKDVLFFENSLIGFPSDKHFLIFEHRKGSHFKWLLSLDQPGLAFPIVDPFIYVEDYDPCITLEEAKALELEEKTPRFVYTMVTVPRGKPDEITINLAGPLIINAFTKKAKQVVLDDERYSIKHSIFSSFSQDNIKKAA